MISANVYVANLLRLLVLIPLQGVILLRAAANSGVEGFAFPLFLLLLPITAPRSILFFIAFVTGLVIDTFYNTLGIHAFTAVLFIQARHLLLGIMEPRGGYGTAVTATCRERSWAWYLQYSGILFFLYSFTWYALDAFALNFRIMGLCFLSFLVSMVLNVLFTALFNPKV